MCLYVLNSKNNDTDFANRSSANRKSKKPFIARAPIEVYKRFIVIGRMLKSPYQNFKYKRDTLYKAEFSFQINDYGDKYDLQIDKGLHAYQTHEGALFSRRSSEIIIKCIIPKGTKYFKGVRDIVSTKLIIGKRKE